MASILPLVSVVVPAHNYARYLPECLESALSQRGGFRLELVAVDDGSTDDTPGVLAAWAARDSRLRVLRQENAGLSAARNTGMAAAEGDFVLFLDADDRLAPGCLEAQLRVLAAEPRTDAAVALCLLDRGDAGTGGFWPVWREAFSLRLCAGNIAPAHCFLLRRSFCRDTGVFDTGLRSLEDYDYWLRGAALGRRFRLAPDALVIYRQHADSMSRNAPVMRAMEDELGRRVDALLEAERGFPEEGAAAGLLVRGASLLERAMEAADGRDGFARVWALRAADILRRAADLPPASGFAVPFHLYVLRALEEPARGLGIPGLEGAMRRLRLRHPDVAALPLSLDVFRRLSDGVLFRPGRGGA